MQVDLVQWATRKVSGRCLLSITLLALPHPLFILTSHSSLRAVITGHSLFTEWYTDRRLLLIHERWLLTLSLSCYKMSCGVKVQRERIRYIAMRRSHLSCPTCFGLNQGRQYVLIATWTYYLIDVCLYKIHEEINLKLLGQGSWFILIDVWLRKDAALTPS